MSVDRRDFLKIVGISGVSAALSGCSEQPSQELTPLLKASENAVPGVASWYATICRECPAGCGVHVRTREGRAVKVEGNPLHPVNRGRLCARGQASLQGLYDPDRTRGPVRRSSGAGFQPVTWDEGEGFFVEKLKALNGAGRAGRIAIVTPQMTGSLDRLVGEWTAALGVGRRVAYETFAHEPVRAANRATFGRDAIPEYAIEEAEVLISFGADFLETWLSNVSYARAFAAMRSIRGGTIGRFIHVEPRMSMTAANADEWIAIKPGAEGLLALGMVAAILREGLADASIPRAAIERVGRWVAPYAPEAVAPAAEVPADVIARLGRTFAGAKPGLALGGGAAVSGLGATFANVAVNLLNYVTGNIGRTIRFGPDALLGRADPYTRMIDLIRAMRAGEVEMLLVHEVNPVFTLPRASGFTEAMDRVPLVVSFSSYLDETAARSHLVLPAHTPLESWGDHEPRAGVRGLMQPAMVPVFDTRGFGDLLLSSVKKVDPSLEERFAPESFGEYVQEAWKQVHAKASSGGEFLAFWEQALRRGGVWETVPTEKVELALDTLDDTSATPHFDGAAEHDLHLLVYPSPHLFDGRGANRAWLQEIPDPVTKIAWDGWVEVHPEAARRLSLEEGDVVAIASRHGTIELPVHLYAYLRPDVVAVPLGQGHTEYGRYARGRGANPLDLLPGDPEPASGGRVWSSTKVRLTKTGRVHPLVTTEGSATQEGREIAQAVPLGEVLMASAAASPPRAASAIGAALATDAASATGAATGTEAARGTAAAALTAAATGAGAATRTRTAPGEGTASADRPLTARGALPALDMYEPHDHPIHRWGMTIDLQSCIGCNACVAACYAENNLAIVGKDQMAKRREMSWIRIERYFEGSPAGPDTRFVPMLCQQCDNAPCEPVCPVNATYHTDEGLSGMVYNRCVGTRFCSNNCPYKVRQFNFSQYEWPEPLNWQLNPDVTVRSVGVMEKCTFCIQRIAEGKDRAKDGGRPVRDGEITPACAQTCPSEAIVFGDLKDPASRVSHRSSDPRGYRVLEALNTKPAITYLKKVRIDPGESGNGRG